MSVGGPLVWPLICLLRDCVCLWVWVSVSAAWPAWKQVRVVEVSDPPFLPRASRDMMLTEHSVLVSGSWYLQHVSVQTRPKQIHWAVYYLFLCAEPPAGMLFVHLPYTTAYVRDALTLSHTQTCCADDWFSTPHPAARNPSGPLKIATNTPHLLSECLQFLKTECGRWFLSPRRVLSGCGVLESLVVCHNMSDISETELKFFCISWPKFYIPI